MLPTDIRLQGAPTPSPSSRCGDAEYRERLGARIQYHRGCVAHSQATLARKVRVHINTLGNWERGLAQPSALMVCRLADALGVSADHLLGTVTERIERATRRRAR